MRFVTVLVLVCAATAGANAQIFRAPAIVAAFPTNSISPTLTADELTVYFTTRSIGGLGNFDVFMMTRSSITSPWSAPVNVTALNSSAADIYIDVRDDDQEMLIGTGRPGGLGGVDIWSATKTVSGWQTPSTVQTAALNTTGADGDATFRRDGLECYYVGLNGTHWDIMRSTRPSTSAAWASPTFAAALNSSFDDHSPTISGDGLCILFVRTNPATGIFIATRPDTSTPFGAPTRLTNLPNFAYNGHQTSDGFSYYFPSGSNIVRADRILPVVYDPAGPPRVGRLFTVYVRHDAGAGQVGVIVGALRRLPAPIKLPGIAGSLEVDLGSGSLFWQSVGGVNPTDGKYTERIPVPAIAALIGRSVHIQGAIQNGATVRIAQAREFTIVP